MIKKTDLMREVARGRFTEIFSHTTLGAFDVTAMRHAAQLSGRKPALVDLLPSIIAFIRESRDIDQERCLELSVDSVSKDPAMAVVMQDAEGKEEHLLIDGVHRILRRAIDGEKTFLCWFIPEAEIVRPDFTGKAMIEWGTFQIDQHGKIYKDSGRR